MNIRHNRTVPLAGSVVGILLAAGLTGCSGMMNSEDFPVDGPEWTATSNPQEVEAADFGHAWNLAVDSGTVSCDESSQGDPILRFTTPDGSVYALNSVEDNSDLTPVSQIADGSIGTLRTFAFQVCDL